jgi:hypothetical protein
MIFKTLAGWTKDDVRRIKTDWKADRRSDRLMAYADAYARQEAAEERQTSWVIAGKGYGVSTLTQEHFDVVPGRWEWMSERGEILYGIDRHGKRVEVSSMV